MSDEWTDDEPVPEDFDPPEHARRYFRHRENGNLAYIVRRGGQDHLKWDREGDDATMPVIEKRPDGSTRTILDRFKPEDEPRPILRAFATQIAWDADRAVLRVLGEYGDARREWVSLSEKERLDFQEVGPKTRNRFRVDMWAAVMSVVREHARR